VTPLEFSAPADADLDEILTYSRLRFGEKVAAEYFFSLDESFGLLSRHPLAGVVADDIRPGLRRFSHRQHRIFYRLVDDKVRILRVLHHAMDVDAHL
jgi:toxin ParE1/3/4